MHSPMVTSLRFASIILFVAGLASCASTGGTRLYADALRPAAGVALIVTADGATRIQAVQARYGQEAKRLFTNASFEVLPGRYSLMATYVASGYTTTTVGKGMEVDRDLKANHVYVLYAKLDYKNNTWQPTLVELPDYRQEDCGGGCFDQKELQRTVTEHFQGERRAVSLQSWGGWQ